MKFIRWKAVIPLLVIIVLILAFSIFFMDTLIKNAVISVGESIFGAKVEISSLRTKFSNLSIEIKDLQVASKTSPFKNVFEIEKIKLSTRPVPILSKKLIINEITVDNVRLGTQRKTSGVLPPRKIKKIENRDKKEKPGLFASLENKIGNEIKALPVTNLPRNISESIKSIDAKKLVNENELKSKKAINELSADTSAKYDKFKNEYQGINIEEQVKNTRALLDSLQQVKVSKAEDIPLVQQKLTELNKQKEALDLTATKMKILQQELNTEIADKTALASQIDDKIKEDYNDIVAKVQIPGLGKGNLSVALFGQAWYSRVNGILHYLEIARKYMPPRKKGQNSVSFARLKGEDVMFFREENLPGLLISRISLGGSSSGDSSGILLKGLITDISSDQQVTGRPTLVKLTGSSGRRVYDADAVFNHTDEPSADKVSLKLKNFELIDSGFLGNIPNLENGIMNLDADFTLTGDELNCVMNLRITDMKFKQEGNPDDLMNKILSSINEITITAKLHGKTDSLKSEFDSNLDDIVTRKMNELYSAKLAETRKAIMDELNARVETEKNALLKEQQAKKDELTKAIQDKTAVIQQARQDVEKKIDELKKQAGQSTETEKKKAEEEIKKKIGPSLEKLFNK